jgi:Protein kinase domain/Kelch motif
VGTGKTDGSRAAPAPKGLDLGIGGCENAVEVGRGGFGAVYRAWQPEFGRAVAVKVLTAGGLDGEARGRFTRELRALGALSGHPHIVTVHSAGFTAGGHPYLVMGFEPGGSLADRLRSRGPLSWEEAVGVGIRISGALESAHRSGVLHRDVKPENILLSAFGEPKLADFGIARVEGADATRTLALVATLAHAAPELLHGDRPSVSSDVYSLGSTLHALIRGRPAFAAEGEEDPLAMIARISARPVPDLRESGVPDAVCRVLERAMAKDPGQRQPSALVLGRELRQAVGGVTTPDPLVLEPGTESSGDLAAELEVVGWPTGRGAAAGGTTSTATLRVMPRVRSRLRRRRALLTSAAAVGVLATAVAVTVGVVVHRPAAQVWVTLVPMPTPREFVATTTGPDGLIYAIGGSDGRPKSPPLTTVEAFDPGLDSWSRRSDLEIGRYDAAAVTAHDGRIVVIGGVTHGLGPEAVLGSVEAYTPSTDRWAKLPSLRTPRRGLAAAVSTDGRIWAIGGFDRDGDPLRSVEVYQPGTGAWVPGPPLRAARADLAAVTAGDGSVYAIGGGDPQDLASVEVLTPGASGWAPAAPLPDPRSGLAAVSDREGHVYAIGGFRGAEPLATVDVLFLDRWVETAGLSTPRAPAAAMGPDGRIYVIGGLGAHGPVGAVEAYTPASG